MRWSIGVLLLLVLTGCVRNLSMLDAFAGTAVSSPSDIKLCFKRAIEKMYEQLYVTQQGAAP